MPHCEYSEYPTADFPVQPQPPPTAKTADHTSAPPHAAGALRVPLGSTQSTPWENVEHQREYSEYPTAGSPPPPTAEALNDTSVPAPTAGASGGLSCAKPRVSTQHYLTVGTPSTPCEYSVYRTGRLGPGSHAWHPTWYPMRVFKVPTRQFALGPSHSGGPS